MKRLFLFWIIACLIVPQLAFANSGKVKLKTAKTEKKVTICHIPPGNPSNAHTIVVDESAVPAHLAHGDYLGACKVSTPTPTPTATVTPSPTEPPSTPTPQPTVQPTVQPTSNTGDPTPIPTVNPTQPPVTSPTPQPTSPPVNPTPEPTPTIPIQCPLYPTGINKSHLLSVAAKLERKAIKYFTKSGKCGNKKYLVQISTTKGLFQLFKTELEAFPVEVELCGTQCVEVVTKELIAQLRKTGRAISKEAVDSQHYGGICHQHGGGIAGTKPIIDLLNIGINSCPTHVCPIKEHPLK